MCVTERESERGRFPVCVCVCFNTVHSTLGKSPDDQTLSLFTHRALP